MTEMHKTNYYFRCKAFQVFGSPPVVRTNDACTQTATTESMEFIGFESTTKVRLCVCLRWGVQCIKPIMVGLALILFASEAAKMINIYQRTY